jgi:polyphosphate kinase
VGDILSTVEQAVKSRRRRGVVRLEVSANPDRRLMDWLVEYCKVTEADIYEIDGLMDATALGELVGLTGSAELKDPDWPPQMPRDLVGADDIWQTLQERDVLLFHPYESFEPVISLLDEAAADPDVLAIKQTLYRTSNESPVIEALARASESGKQVTVLLEVKARFDEYRNVQSARRLEDAGCHVIYGVAGYKTHSKLLLIVRREPSGIRRYLHMSTGNYNERTARLYSDIGFMTTERDLASDAAAYFNTLTGYSDDVGWSKLAVAPTGLRGRLLELIKREIHTSTSDQPGLIMAKLNSLQHKAVCKALYEASRAGVKIKLNVRGICCLRPGVKGLSENIEVTSIVDRYLEHARICYFLNGGNEEVYLSSADWMKRNLDNRLEVMFPVAQPNLRDRLKAMLHTYFADNVKAWRLRADGPYERVRREGPPVRAQEKLYFEALEAVEAAGAAQTRLRPLMNPEEGRRRSV